MSNTLFTAAALGTVLFLYGIAGDLDIKEAADLAPAMQEAPASAAGLLRLVCLPDGAAWPHAVTHASASRRPLVLAAYRTAHQDDDGVAIAMRCLITNE